MSRSGETGERSWVLEVEDRDRYPFGVPGLDNNINGGAPDGSLVLAAGEAGAGGREFLYTSALMNALADTDPDLFDLYYGELGGAATLAEEIHYVSFTEGESSIREEMLYTMDSAIVESGIDWVQFTDLSAEYFQLSPVPREWYAGERESLAEMGSSAGDRQDVIEALADHLEEYTPGNIVYVDSLTDLVGVRETDVFEWRDIIYLLQGLRRAIKSWGGVVVVYVGQEVLSDRRLGDLMAAVDGTMLFEWAAGGNERARTMVVREFRGVLSELEGEDIVRFETDINEGGFDISNIRKIR
ncbi:MAG: RAD55 family ATPase [Halobacteriaceae archaeon]